MRKYLTALFPSLAATLGMVVLPAVFTIYYLVTEYSRRFVNEQEINYFDVQSNFLGRIFLEQSWISWFNRFMDFAFWGIIAAIVLVGLWLFSSAKVATNNHYAEESFTNFRGSTTSWHTHFVVVALLRVTLVFTTLYGILAIVGQAIPKLQTALLQTLQNNSWPNIKTAIIAGLSIVLYQYLIVTCVKVFKHLSAD